MRNAAVVIALTLLIPAVRAAEVEVVQPHVAFLSETGVAAACKGVNRRGCTTLMTEFVCACIRGEKEDTWTLRPHLMITPYVYTTGASIMRHEFEHITDVRTSLKEYVGLLSLHVFTTEDSCLTFITDEKKLFPSMMRNIQRMTTVRRDGMQFAQHEAGDH